MKQKKIFTFVALGFALTANAQKPFKDIAKDNEVELLTLSNGRYVEHFINDTLRRIGSVMFNTVTNKIEYFIPQDDITLRSELDRTKEVSRWMSVDPSAHKFPDMSPYSGMGNNPITTIDPDGAVIINFLLANTKHSAALTQLKSGQIFNQIYTQLQTSTTVYALNAYMNGPKNEPKSANGHFLEKQYPNTNVSFEIGLKPYAVSNKDVIFEEVFHAGQNEFYGENEPSSLAKEVEVRVASAFEDGTQSTFKAVPDFAKNNATYINKIKSGETVSAEEEKQFRTNVISLSRNVAGTYSDDTESNNKGANYRDEAQSYGGETKYLDSIVKKKE